MGAVIAAAMLQVSCSSSPGNYAATPDPAKGKIIGLECPEISCPGQKSLVPISVSVTIDSTVSPSQVCWVGIYQDLGLSPGDELLTRYKYFNQSGTVFFDDIDLNLGSYFALVGLSFNSWCRSLDSYDTSRWLRISVGGAVCDSQLRVMDVEYDCQASYDIQYGDLQEPQSRLTNAFLPAQTSVIWNVDNTTLTDTVLIDYGELARFINNNYPPWKHMYIAGIKDWALRGPTALAGTWPSPSTGQWGDPDGWALVYVQHIIDTYTSPPYNWPDFYIKAELCPRVVVHELGHQRADLSHQDQYPGEHDPNYHCVMVSGMPIEPLTHYFWGMDYVYFCDSCCVGIAAKTW